MAESIKFNSDKYLDATGIKDSTLNKFQSEINLQNTFRILYNGNMDTVGTCCAYFANFTNAPTSYMIGFSFIYSPTDGVQFGMQVGTTSFFVRSKSGGVWTAWRTI